MESRSQVFRSVAPFVMCSRCLAGTPYRNLSCSDWVTSRINNMLSFTLWSKPRDQLRHLKIIAVKAEFPLIYIVQFALPTTIARGDFANYRNEIRFITIKSGAIAALNGCCPMLG